MWSSRVRLIPVPGSADGASQFFLYVITDRGLEISIFDADFGKALRKDGGLFGRSELLVDNDKAFSLEDAKPAFKITFFVANGDAAVRRKSFKFLENLVLGHTFSHNDIERENERC